MTRLNFPSPAFLTQKKRNEKAKQGLFRTTGRHRVLESEEKHNQSLAGVGTAEGIAL